MKKRKFQVGDVTHWYSWGGIVYGVVLWVGRVDGKVRYQVMSSDLFGQVGDGRMYNRLAVQMKPVIGVTGVPRRNMQLVRMWEEGVFE